MSHSIEHNGPLRSDEQAKETFLAAYYAFVLANNISQRHMAKELGIKLSTIRDTCDRHKPNLNTKFVIAFCLKYGVIDVETVYRRDVKEPDDLKRPNEKNFTVFRHSYDCHELTDPAFMGTFFGLCRNTQYPDILADFILRIRHNTHNELQAELELHTYNRKMEATTKYLYGKPMHLHPNIIYIVCQSDRGDDMCILSYTYFKISPGNKLYCQDGAMITPCRSTERFPQMQSFVFLDQPIKPENRHYIDGFLKLTQDKIVVPADKYDELMTSNECVKNFFEQCKDIQYRKEEYVCFSEKVLTAMGEANNVDFDTTAAAILMLKQRSINPDVIDFPNKKLYSKFLSGLTQPEEPDPNQ